MTSTPDSAPSANNGGLAAPLGPATGGASTTMEGGGLVMRVTLRALGRVGGRATSFPLAAARVFFGGGRLGGATGQARRRVDGTGSATDRSVHEINEVWETAL